MLPFEFIIPGPPRSQQTRHRVQLRTWKDAVREAASRRWPVGAVPVSSEIRIVVQYFHEKPRTLIDGDNLLKPIQDALIGLVYDDDRQIIDAVTQKRPIDDPFFVRYISMVLAEGFAQGDEFVYVRVEQLTDRARIQP
jgi:Holliday junction resolvase RusA-like endonuclease